MKETQPLKEDQIHVIAEQQQEKQVRLIGQQGRRPGLILWELNLKQQTLNPAQFKKDNVEINSLKPTEVSATKHLIVDIKPDCMYFQALNRKSAMKKLNKRVREITKSQRKAGKVEENATATGVK
jgi:hypothetical protein